MSTRPAPVAAVLIAAIAVALGGAASIGQSPSVAAGVATAVTPTTTAPGSASAAVAAARDQPAPGRSAPASPTDPTVAVEPVERLEVEVIETIPHDAGSFTQGLVLDGEVMYESDGGYGDSTLRAVDADTGSVLRVVGVGAENFAEGLALVGHELVQLTWREGRALRWDAATFAPRPPFTYSGEGWGLCYDEPDDVLYMSDGSSTLFARDPATFEIVDEVDVTLDGEPVVDLNELECADGIVYANVWHRDEIVRVEASTGRITAVIDASGLLSDEQRAALGGEAVLNGIAARDDGTLVLTGKLWPEMFVVELVSASSTTE